MRGSGREGGEGGREGGREGGEGGREGGRGGREGGGEGREGGMVETVTCILQAWSFNPQKYGDKCNIVSHLFSSWWRGVYFSNGFLGRCRRGVPP